jgi:hypothetical protein
MCSHTKLSMVSLSLPPPFLPSSQWSGGYKEEPINLELEVHRSRDTLLCNKLRSVLLYHHILSLVYNPVEIHSEFKGPLIHVHDNNLSG